jgi:hypothetical protein
MDKFVVISCNRYAPPIRIHIDAACEGSPNSALRRIGNLRPTSHVLIAMTPTHLRDWADKLAPRSPQETAPTKFVVISCDPSPVCVHMDAVCASNSDSALIQVSEQRQAAHILLALTSAQLRELAHKLDRRSPAEISMTQDAALQEEFQALQAEGEASRAGRNGHPQVLTSSA